MMLPMGPKPKSLIVIIVAMLVGSPRALPASDISGERPKLIMIIRHGEKPEGEKDVNLTAKGYARANALATVIPDRFPKPDFLFAARKSKGSDRPIETITPLSKALDEPIDSQFKAEAVDQLAHAVLSPRYAGKVVLICWHHEKIPALAKALGVTDAPDKWNAKVFDEVWEITYDGNAASWKQVPEEALPGDSTN